MARPKKQPDYDVSWENYNRQYQVHQLLRRNVRFQKDAEATRHEYGLSEANSIVSENQKEAFITDIGKIVAKVNMPGHYEEIVLALILDETPVYDGYMLDLPKQPLDQQFRVKTAMFKNLLLYHFVKERGMSFKEAVDHMADSDFGLSEAMNYSDMSKHLAKIEQQIEQIYS